MLAGEVFHIQHVQLPLLGHGGSSWKKVQLHPNLHQVGFCPILECTNSYLTYRSVPELPLTNLENRPYCTGHQLRCMEVCARLYNDFLAVT